MFLNRLLPAAVSVLHDDYKLALYATYFEKDFPDVDPLILTDQQWHSESMNVNDWLQLTREEFALLQSWQRSNLGIDHEFKIARAKWKEYYDR
jgi:hypothetical protein